MAHVEAIVTGVPLIHLETAERTLDQATGVYFATEKSFFAANDVIEGAPVYIRASHREEKREQESIINWQGEFGGYRAMEEMKPEDWARIPEVAGETSASSYFLVRSLRRLGGDSFPITDILKADGTAFNPAYLPRGPIAVQG